MEAALTRLLTNCCPCIDKKPEASDDDQVNVKSVVVCCVRTQEVKIDFADATDGDSIPYIDDATPSPEKADSRSVSQRDVL